MKHKRVNEKERERERCSLKSILKKNTEAEKFV